MRLYVADYLSDTTHLTTTEHGAYLLLIMAYWRNDGPLPDDDKKLARIVGMKEKEWAKTRQTVADLFQVTAGHWRHKRIDAELKEVHDRSNKARASVRTRYDRSNPTPTNVDGSTYERSTNDLRGGYAEATSQRSEIRDQSNSYQVPSPQESGPQRAGHSESVPKTKNPREARRSASVVQWPKLGDEPA